eukprot:3873913-Amphidinium_carterae.2
MAPRSMVRLLGCCSLQLAPYEAYQFVACTACLLSCSPQCLVRRDPPHLPAPWHPQAGECSDHGIVM